ncbi:hypothetical protein [Corynebacterium lizhenjunii]|uniref:hypothetical protein n=1 Tax=Corynebacterium lizhenjunii TaxID=2709394 RepID=UPI001FD39F97|nr:hypothetical protein [Corynebacterium lizhenjunii]
MKSDTRRSLGAGAGVLACALIAYSAAGALWGLWRPAVSGQAVGDGHVSVDTVADVQFASLGSFALITTLLGLVLGSLAYVRAGDQRGIGMLLWVGVVALAGAAAFFVCGGATATSVAPDSVQPGQTVSWVPAMSPGVAWVCSSFGAMLAYWSAAFVSADSDWEAQGQGPSTRQETLSV